MSICDRSVPLGTGIRPCQPTHDRSREIDTYVCMYVRGARSSMYVPTYLQSWCTHKLDTLIHILHNQQLFFSASGANLSFNAEGTSVVVVAK